MLELYFTENENVYEKLNSYLSRLLPEPFKILRTVNGKPYLEGDPLFFSLSHSKNKALIAISDKPVGADMEVITDRKYSSVLSRLSKEEREEIADVTDFLKHWVVREAYIKMLGSTISEKLNGLNFTNGILYDNALPADCELQIGFNDGCVYCICLPENL